MVIAFTGQIIKLYTFGGCPFPSQTAQDHHTPLLRLPYPVKQAINKNEMAQVVYGEVFFNTMCLLQFWNTPEFQGRG